MQCHVSLGGLLRQCNNKCELRIKQAQTGFISGEQPRLGRVPKGSSEIRSESAEGHYPSQLLPEQRHMHLVEVKYCKDTRPKNNLEASKQQHHYLCCNPSMTAAQVTLHTMLLGVAGVIYTPHTLEPLKELGLDIYNATKLALKLHARLKKNNLNSHRQDQI
eukprot:1159542-Pelagomonas_calceolata.AAC.2